MTGRLADFVIVGEMKCGTTSLAHHLDDHPALGVSDTMPVRFFDERWDRGIAWYEERFAAIPDGVARGDDTPNYLFDADAVRRLVDTLPEARLVVLLREPTSRAWSHYWHHDRSGFDRRGFGAAVTDELTHGVGAAGTPEGSAYVARGHYDVTVGRLFDLAGRERVHVAFFDDLRRDPLGTVQAVYRFLDVDERHHPSTIETVFNVGWAARSRRFSDFALRHRLPRRLPFGVGRRLLDRNTRRVAELEMPAALADRLGAHYAPHNAALRELLGDRPVPPWLTG